MGADDARLPSLHEIASRPHPANHAQRAGHQQPNPTNLAAGAAPLPARCAAAGCRLQAAGCLSSLSTLSVQSVCAPRCSILAPRSSRRRSPVQDKLGRPGEAEEPPSPIPSQDDPPPPYPPFPAGNPAARKRKESLRCWTQHPKVTRPSALHTSARPRPPLVGARVCLTEQASHDASLPPSLCPCLRTEPPHPSPRRRPHTSLLPNYLHPCWRRLS